MLHGLHMRKSPPNGKTHVHSTYLLNCETDYKYIKCVFYPRISHSHLAMSSTICQPMDRGERTPLHSHFRPARSPPVTNVQISHYPQRMRALRIILCQRFIARDQV